ncbi:toxin secretion/phage lysis holin [Clostridium aceticum]|uniref:Toxin secretion/phage lysis holin n=1 Tax=Clostridium aceticum TaxID=84022 RepID=A0A0D8I7T6_9CLOT|nr:phage holin family protein [Clostridium aceticum]AKL96605.1 toxin secretion/phage lysis holin [Clostridium aceticum]KJF26087.1 holin [Clostridium aceticum]
MENISSIIKTSLAIIGGAASYLLGGWSHLLGVLLFFVVLDYISGIVAATVNGELSSATGFKGIAKKVFIFALVVVANMIDMSLGNGNILKDATIFFYLANESISIIENAGRIGVDIPKSLERAVEILKDKGEGNR